MFNLFIECDSDLIRILW